MDIPNADPCWNVRKGVRMQLGPNGQVRVKEPWLGCACEAVYRKFYEGYRHPSSLLHATRKGLDPRLSAR